MRKSNINKLMLTFLLTLFGHLGLSAQDEEVKSTINDIKLDDSYIYGEGTDVDKNIAYNSALREIVEFVNEERFSKHKTPIEEGDIVGKLSQYGYNRGEAEYVFVYIKLSDAMAILPHKAQQDEQVPIPSKEKIPTQSNLVAEPSSIHAIVQVSEVGDGVLSYLMEFSQVTDLLKGLERFKTEGKISEINVLQSIEDIPNDAYLVVYDRDHAIVALMSPLNEGQRLNYMTKQSDSVQNYHGCGVLWYR